jgi:16S rRNA (guanine(966)-N(2))-methyltransferase RsmD
MRIVGGSLRGRRLAAVRGPVRPTSDRLRQALFDVLGTAVQGSVFLDLYAGTGAVGLEAWSRGASPVILVERDAAALRLIRRNLELCGVVGELIVRQQEVFAFLAAPDIPAPADFAYLDPPYAMRRYDKLLSRVAASPAVAVGGLVLLELAHRTALPGPPKGLQWERDLEAGDSRVIFLRKNQAAADSLIRQGPR